MFWGDPIAFISAVPPWAYYSTVFFLALITAFVLTPVAKDMALKFDIVDHPGERKIHTQVVPYLGGVAIYAAFWTGVIVIAPLHIQQLGAIVLGATLVMLLGLWDDRNGMGPGIKLGGQLLCAVIVVSADIQFRVIQNWYVNAGLTTLWIVGITNALNLMDNMDGLSTGTTLISAVFLFFLGANNGQFLVASMALSLAGACLGFLRFNRAPATIFMGDAGSLFLGFMVSVLGIKIRPPTGTPDGTFWVAVVLLGLPILDTTLVTTQRILNGRPFYLGGRDHCSHRLVTMGMTRTDAVYWLYMVAGFYGFLAVLVNALGLHPLILGFIVVCSATLYLFFASIDAYATPRRTPEMS